MKKIKLALVLCTALASGAVVSARLIGVSMLIGDDVPRTDVVGPAGSFSYDAVSRNLSLLINEGFIGSSFLLNGPFRPHLPTPTANTLAINIKVLADDGSTYAGNGQVDDFQMTGTVDINGNGAIDPGESGTLLRGSLLQFGFSNPTGTTDGADFRFAVTGGVWAPLYAGRDIGVREIIESSTWAAGGNFSTSFTGAVKGNVLPIPCVGTIGDFVWNDLNRNGVQEPGEPGLNGVTVRLTGTTLNGSLPVGQTVVTGNNPVGGQPGFYQFTGLCLGTYTVTVDESTAVGFIPTTSGAGADRAVDSNTNNAVVTLNAANYVNGDQTIDFGFKSACSGSIGDFVWHDQNRNGIQDSGEPGIQGVVVKLERADGSVITTTTTGANGSYQFSGLCAGAYRVEVDAATVPSGFAPTVSGFGGAALDSNPTPTDVTLASDSATDSTVDFGYTGLCTGVIGDFVWFDDNHNGLQDPFEAGIDGLTVTLSGPGGSRTTTTGVNPIDNTKHGYYQFTGLCTGTYTVSTTAPVGFIQTNSAPGSNPALDSNTAVSTVALTNDFGVDETIDFGFMSCPGSIGDLVWQDLNANGVQDAGEPGFPGVTVNLRRALDNAILQTATTGADGVYKFNGVCPANYKVEAMTPAGATASPTGLGTLSTDSNVNPSIVSLTLASNSDTTIDFGFRPNGSIGDRVWSDANGNRMQDGSESGLVGWTVTISGPNSYTSSQTTGADGIYTFNALMPGTYSVCVTPQAGYTETFDLDFPATANCAPRTIGAGEHASDVDFGYWRPASIGDRVWNDVNANGVIDGGELGLGGWIVTISGAALPGGYVAAQSTGGDGFYTFNNLPAGVYKVCVTPQSGYVQTFDLDGLATAHCALRTVAAGENATNVDFGYRSVIDLSVTKTVNNATPTVGSNVVFTVTVANASGFTTATGVTVKDVLPLGLTYVSASGAGSYSSATGIWTVGTLASPGTASLTITATVTTGGTKTNLAQVQTATQVDIDSTPGNAPGTHEDDDASVSVTPPASLGDVVWNDKNANGLQDAGEPGIPGVLATLLKCDGTTTGLMATTNASGVYLFANLAPGCYKVQFGTPAGFTASPTNVGANDAIDSDAAAGVTGTYTLGSGETNLTVDAGFVPVLCVTGTFDFTGGNSATAGTAGNIRTFTVNGVSVHVTAFGETKPTSGTHVFSPAYLGAFPMGLGVTDSSESGASNTHIVDNSVQNNYILMEFSQPVTVDRAYLDYIVGDSDIKVWIGTVANAYTSHQTLNAALLTSLGFNEVNAGGSAARWADINAGLLSGNVLVIAAQPDATGDGFKLSKVDVNCGAAVCSTVSNFSFTGNTAISGTAGNTRTFTVNGVSVKASAFSRNASTGAWETAYLGLYGPGLGVTNRTEDGTSNSHKIDNIGGKVDHVLFEFSTSVVVDQAFLDAIGNDSDIKVWVGTKSDPFDNHLTLSDSLLSSLGLAEENVSSAAVTSRWADINAGATKGNVLVIAALPSDTSPEDEFKISKLNTKCN